MAQDERSRIALDAGHGGRDPGAVFGDLEEKTITLAIVKELETKLLAADYRPLLTRSMDHYVGINERAIVANLWEVDLFVSIHCNADPDNDAPGKPEAHGCEIWIYEASVKGRLFAEQLHVAAVNNFPQEAVFRGIKETTHLGVLTLTKAPAALIEVGFIDTVESFKLADPAIQKRIAQAVFDGIVGYFVAESVI